MNVIIIRADLPLGIAVAEQLAEHDVIVMVDQLFEPEPEPMPVFELACPVLYGSADVVDFYREPLPTVPRNVGKPIGKQKPNRKAFNHRKR